MTEEISDLEIELYKSSVRSEEYPDTLHQKHLFEQYKICIEMADRISQRRSIANTLLLTLNTGVLGALAAFFGKTDLSIGGVVVSLIALVGLIISCQAWRILLRSYRQLNAAKFKVIGALERKLPASPYYSAEWTALGQGKDKNLYTPLSAIEIKLPVILSAAYLLIIVFIVIDQKRILMGVFSS